MVTGLEQAFGGAQAPLGFGDQFANVALAQTAMPSSRMFAKIEKSPRSVMVRWSTTSNETMMPAAIETSVAAWAKSAFVGEGELRHGDLEQDVHVRVRIRVSSSAGAKHGHAHVVELSKLACDTSA